MICYGLHHLTLVSTSVTYTTSSRSIEQMVGRYLDLGELLARSQLAYGLLRQEIVPQDVLYQLIEERCQELYIGRVTQYLDDPIMSHDP